MANLAEKIERYVEVGQTIHVDVIWRGQHYSLQMFFPGSTIPRKEDVQKQVQGVYPNAVVTRVVPATTDPTKPTIRVTKEGVISEEGLRDWFGKSKSKDGKKGWVNVVTGDSCASDKPGEGIPKCVSSAKRASMSKKERRAAAAAKRREDPGQQRKSGAAAPTMVKTDRKKTKKEELELLDAYGEPFAVIQDLVKPEPMKKEEPQIDLSTYDIEAMTEAKDKKGKGSGTKDACYHKVKSRYSVWPSAYASGALVKCRKVGASNWGNSKKEDFSYELNDEYYNTLFEKCWKGYEKKGMKTMFGKRYPNCVKKEETEVEEANKPAGVRGAYDKNPPGQYQVGDTIPASATGESDYKKRRMATLKRILKDNPKNWDFSQQNVDRRQVSGESVDPMTEDWQKKSGKNPEGGLNEKGRKSYERENPGSDLKRPSKKVGNPRRKSFCARMKGMKKKLTSAKTANDPDSRINKSLRAWNC
ncbi:hypothetical protein [Synechococcus phage S-8S55]|jgi:hypothetical protein|nr:hypothetical protein [Synechococcus phage S-8S55]